MSDVVAFARRSDGPKLKIGLLRLTDSAPVITAHEFGFFADEGLEVELFVEPSWANIADKLTYGFIDAAVIVPPLAFAVEMGVRGVTQPLVIPYTLSAGGNSITLAPDLAEQVNVRAERDGLSTLEALAVSLRAQNTTLGVVHAYSTHNLLLRYWLAMAGITAGRDVTLSVVPPARAVEALGLGRIAGFCAGAPWGEVAQRTGAGSMVATSYDIWRKAPEKAFAVSARWAEEHPQMLSGALRALLRASKFCDDPQNATYTAALLSRRKYVDVDSHAILAGLPGGGGRRGGIFFRGAATFPFPSHALWFLSQMQRWDMLDRTVDLRALAARVYRPDIYRTALAPVGETVPVQDWKTEGAHTAPWALEATPDPIAMPADSFCDGAVFEPDAVPAPSLPTKSALHNL